MFSLCYQDAVNDYQCECVAGFTGRNCEINIDECQTAPCNNNGTCIDQVNGYRCNCLQGFSDFNCSTNIDDCNSTLCSNGGDELIINSFVKLGLHVTSYFLYISCLVIIVIKVLYNHTERIRKYILSPINECRKLSGMSILFLIGYIGHFEHHLQRK